jgi:diguanylate cyclase (GGDEF)-like protein
LPRQEGTRDAAELDFLRALADRSALALHNASLFSQSVQAARRDSLTQALNRGAFQARLNETFTEASEKRLPVALLMLDADHFKRCNDTHGHAFGDRVLVLLARTIRDQIRPTDTLGRWGGEEFAVILPGADAATARKVAERIRSAMTSLVLSLPTGEEVAAPTVSIGVACHPGPEQHPDRLMEAADAALYRAKAQGRNCVCLAPGQ